MIRMSRGAQFVRLLVAAAVMFSVVGCCGGGPSHKCDFTSAPTTHDGGSDAPVPCGTDVCQPPQVCCLKKSPLLALCIDVENFQKNGCEMPDAFPCLVPADCPAGLACCFDTRLAGCLGDKCLPPISCRPAQYCPSDNTTFLTCASSGDCPGNAPSCTFLGASSDGTVLNVCI